MRDDDLASSEHSCVQRERSRPEQKDGDQNGRGEHAGYDRAEEIGGAGRHAKKHEQSAVQADQEGNDRREKAKRQHRSAQHRHYTAPHFGQRGVSETECRLDQ